MAEDDTELPDMTDEGISTLAAQFSRRGVNRITGIIRRLRAEGKPENVIAKAMERDLSDYDEHTRGLLLRLAGDGPIPDDFPPATVRDSKQPKPNTMELTLTGTPPGVQLHSIVRYQEKQWLVAGRAGDSWMLKLLAE